MLYYNIRKMLEHVAAIKKINAVIEKRKRLHLNQINIVIDVNRRPLVGRRDKVEVTPTFAVPVTSTYVNH
jgi:hypothetical protein